MFHKLRQFLSTVLFTLCSGVNVQATLSMSETSLAIFVFSLELEFCSNENPVILMGYFSAWHGKTLKKGPFICFALIICL